MARRAGAGVMVTALALGALIAGGLAAYVALAMSAASHGVSAWWFVLALPAAWLAIPFLFAAAWFALARRFGVDPPDDAQLSPAQRRRVFWREVRALGRSGHRMMLYKPLMRDPPPAPAALPVLLVHGVACNAGIWYGFRRALEALGVRPVYAISYGPPLASIERFAEQLAAKIGAVTAATGARDVVLVSHSMGGLVCRAYLRRFGGAKVRRLIAIAAPHRGSHHARFFPGRSLAEMRPGNAWLEELNVERAQGVPVVNLWSWHDSMVTPQTSSRLEWAEDVAFAGIAHNAMLDDPAVIERVADEIRRAENADRPGLPDERRGLSPFTNGSPA
jgi:triacylglycerol esterase/lipase EstA (alpha/beta hydrolase family)